MATNKLSFAQKLKRRIRTTMFSAEGYEFGAITVLSIIVGVLAGYGAIGFYLGISMLLGFSFGVGEDALASAATRLPSWQIILTPVVGGLIVGQLLRFLPTRQTHSVPHVIESAALTNGEINAKDGIVSAAITLISLGSGASLGREGPVVHMGATIASVITRYLHLNPSVARTLLGCGVASAVAASFNAPIAGVFFALEVIIGHYALHTFAPIVIAAIAGTLVSRAHLGNFPAFETSQYFITSFWEFPAFFFLGIVASIVSILFMSGLNWSDKIRIHFHRIPYSLLPALAGLIIGIIALIYPEILSVGYEATSLALNGAYSFDLFVALLLAKMVATIISYGGRFGGGVFSPSLFLGAMLGGAFGILASSVFPDLASSPGLYAVVGMGAVASAVLGAPISTMLIVFEITGDYNVTIAVMIASAVASMLTSLFYERSFFLMQLANRGIRLEGGRASFLLESSKVEGHMTRDFFTVQENEPAVKARELLIAQEGGLLIVTDETGNMMGTVGFGQLPANIFEDHTTNTHAIRDYMRDISYTVKTTDPLQVALSRMDMSGDEILPVVSPGNRSTVVGLVKKLDVLNEYNRALLESQGRDRKVGRRG
ncbi:chloride channel protein [Kordiimonas pumila]|uniref:Chloride channel protein n=1 Tax=Kordiimonas pumila TaxID=2161677 RepID=A0ABV7D878_9PROT|nr:chloride channel protein [Kordiimonas pumila]